MATAIARFCSTSTGMGDMSQDTTTELEELLEHIKKVSEEWAEQCGPDGDWNPLLFILDEERHMQIVAVDMPENEFRDDYFSTFIPNIVKGLSIEPKAVVFLSSVWFLSVDSSVEDMENYDGPLPSQSINRREALLITGISHDQELSVMAEIIRSDGPPALEWMENPEGMGGRMMGGLRRAIWK